MALKIFAHVSRSIAGFLYCLYAGRGSTICDGTGSRRVSLCAASDSVLRLSRVYHGGLLTRLYES